MAAQTYSTLTWVVRPLCVGADAALSRGIGSDGWAAAVVSSCGTLLAAPKDARYEEYSSGLAAWRVAHWPRALAVTLLIAAVLIPLARMLLDPIFLARVLR